MNRFHPALVLLGLLTACQSPAPSSSPAPVTSTTVAAPVSTTTAPPDPLPWVS